MLAQGYHWTLDDINKLSYAQILLLQHAADYNRKLLDKRLEEGRANNSLSASESLADAPLYGGKRFDELTSEDLMALAGPEGRAPKIIKLRKDPPADVQEQDS